MTLLKISTIPMRNLFNSSFIHLFIYSFIQLTHHSLYSYYRVEHQHLLGCFRRFQYRHPVTPSFCQICFCPKLWQLKKWSLYVRKHMAYTWIWHHKVQYVYRNEHLFCSTIPFCFISPPRVNTDKMYNTNHSHKPLTTFREVLETVYSR